MGEKALLARLLPELGLEDNDLAYVGGLAVKIDGAAASRSKMPFMDWRDFGWRAVAAAYSDFRVKLATPRYALASVTAPTAEVAEEVVRGVVEACRRLDIAYLGGDLNEGDDAVVDVAMWGEAPRPIGRRPGPGDTLVTIPLFGHAGLAFRAWGDPAAALGVEMLRRPLPTWPLPPAHCVTASMDSSDGLADVLWTMARGVDIVVTSLPAPPEVAQSASRLGLDLEELVFNAGEEFLPVFALRGECGVPEGYVAFAEVRPGEGVVWWRGAPLRHRGWSYFAQATFGEG